MTTSDAVQGTKRRGPYAKGRQSRELILDTALEVIGREGYTSVSLRHIAAETEMTQAGLLHHFGTKEQLFLAVLQARDEANANDPALAPSGLDGAPRTVLYARHSVTVPGLVHLFVGLQAAAGDPRHPAHEFFRLRDGIIRARVAADIRQRQAAGFFDPDTDPEDAARMIMAVSDGLQAEWAIDPTIDLVGTLSRLWERLSGRPLPVSEGTDA